MASKNKILFILFALTFSLQSQDFGRILNSGWQFRQKGKDKWYKATVPGNVHTDLYANQLIPDPFKSDNEKKLQWIEKENWEYQCSFVCDKAQLNKQHIELIFEGLDTYAQIFLNGKQILEANNMFRTWRKDVKALLKEGNNELKIEFASASETGKKLASALTYTLPGEERVFTRKAQFQYGWDFAPRFVTCGVWKNVKLFAWDHIKINSISYKQDKLDENSAELSFFIDCESDEKNIYELVVTETSKNISLKRNDTIKSGRNTIKTSFKIENPALWWCNGYGEPKLYDFDFEIRLKEKKESGSHLKLGLRKIELIRSADSSGTSFGFMLNGVNIFAKGANYVPQDVFLSSVKKEDYQQMVKMAKSANMNMLRVWGGGTYADDEFYNACDQNGILVWQDLMFAGAMYPIDSLFTDNVREEVSGQVCRLRHHPCIALWCGNNEISEGWYNWGWQKQFAYSKKDSTAIIKAYNHLFRRVIPDVLKESIKEKVNYWPGSPLFGWGRKESLLHGDSHYWGVWWGKEPFEIYETKVGRFMSEYGFQSMPAAKTVKQFGDSAMMGIKSADIKNHQKHPAGFEIIQTYLERDFKMPQNQEDYIYVSQLLQSRGMQTAIEAHRRARPWCQGTLFWQLNDCWPGISWSAIDYFKTPKAFYYHLSDLYRNCMISFKKEKDSLKVFFISDSSASLNGELNLSIKDFSGQELFTRSVSINCEAQSAGLHFTFTDAELKKFDPAKTYIKAVFTSGKLRVEKLCFLTQPKKLALSKADIKVTWSPDKKSVQLSSPVFVKNLAISLDDGSVLLSNNFFNMEAGLEYNITILSPVKDFKSLKLTCLNNLVYK